MPTPKVLRTETGSELVAGHAPYIKRPAAEREDFHLGPRSAGFLGRNNYQE